MHHSPRAGQALEVTVGVKTWRNGGWGGPATSCTCVGGEAAPIPPSCAEGAAVMIEGASDLRGLTTVQAQTMRMLRCLSHFNAKAPLLTGHRAAHTSLPGRIWGREALTGVGGSSSHRVPGPTGFAGVLFQEGGCL